MNRKLLMLIFILFFVNITKAQKSPELIEMFVDYYNNKDSLKLNRLLHKDFKGYWEDHIVIKNKEEFFSYFSRDSALNSFESIKITKTTKDSIKTISTYSSDYFRALNAKPSISEKVYHIKKGKIIRIVQRIPEEFKEYNELRVNVFSDFRLWLRNNYCISPSQFDRNGKEAGILKRIALAYSKKEFDNFLNEYKSYNLKKFIQEPNELELQEFIFKAINLLKEKKHTEFLDLYLTKDEFIECYKYYGYSADKAIQEYKENVFIPDLEWVKSKSEKKFFNCYMNYTVVNNIFPKITELSKILRSKNDLKSNEEYYFCHAIFEIRAFGYGFHEGYEVIDDITSKLNFGEVIYIPKKGWRLMDQLR